jgi:hypothetical protein
MPWPRPFSRAPRARVGRRRRKKRGFTLIESMVAGVMLIIGVSGVVSALGSVMKLKSHQRDLTVAIHAAETSLEELLMLPSDHPDMAAGAGVQPGPSFDLNMRRGGTEFTTEFEVVTGPYVGTRTVVVTVRWTDGFGRPKVLALRTHRR